MRWMGHHYRAGSLRRHFATCGIVLACGMGCVERVLGQDGAPPVNTPEEALEGRPVRRISFVGLNRVSEQLVLNNIRTVVGEPYSAATISQDVHNLTRLNHFRLVIPLAQALPDGGVSVTYQVEEWPLAQDIQVTGNLTVDDQDIFDAILMRPRDPLDSFQINRAREAIIEMYRKRGYYLAQVEVDSEILTESNIVLFRVREGPRVKIKAIEFRGNESFSAEQLQPSIKTKTSLFLFRTGQLDEEALARDVAALTNYYKDRGYLDVRIERQIDLSTDLKEAKVVFLIEERALFTMRRVEVEGATRLLREQVAGLIPIKSGDVYSRDRIEKSRRMIEESLGRLGYVDVRVEAKPTRDPNAAFVDLLLIVSEGNLAYAGEVIVNGNMLTKREVIQREMRIYPDRPLSRVAMTEAERHIRATGLFSDVSITAAPPDPEDPLYRDVLVEVAEGDTGSINFGAAVSSDLGVFGSIGLTQRNFDITDFPQSFDEFIKGRAFRGAGQIFNIELQPGDRYTNIGASISDPYAWGTNNAVRTGAQYTIRELESYDEERWGGSVQVSRRIGDVWTAAVNTRFQSIDLGNIDSDAPVDVFAVEDENQLTGLGFSVIRSTADNRFRPSKGSRTEFGFEQVGALGGDFDFSRVTAEHTVFLTIDEDFLGRKSVLSLSGRISHQFGGTTPIYERFFLGGRSLRGFDYRTVSPKGVRNDTGRVGEDPVGGDWLVFMGAEYEFPVFKEFIGGVIFLDSGTVTNDPGFDDYRVAVGMGIRLYIPQLGQAPLAFDLAVPIQRLDSDERRYFSFSLDLPF